MTAIVGTGYALILWYTLVVFAPFFVASTTRFLLLSLMFLPLGWFITFVVFKKSISSRFFLAHLFLALIVHPGFSIWDKDWSDDANQLYLLETIHKGGDRTISNTEYLVLSLAERERSRLKHNRPIVYWLFPPSVVLLIGSVLCLIYLPGLNDDHPSPPPRDP